MNKPVALRSIVSGVVDRTLADGRCKLDDVVGNAFDWHADLLASHADDLMYSAVKDIARGLLADRSSDDDDQLSLPGLHLPTSIAVRPEVGEIYYVRADQATWSELLAGREERAGNVLAAQRRLDQYNSTLDRLRRWMENDPDCSVADALAREAQAAA